MVRTQVRACMPSLLLWARPPRREGQAARKLWRARAKLPVSSPEGLQRTHAARWEESGRGALYLLPARPLPTARAGPYNSQLPRQTTVLRTALCLPLLHNRPKMQAYLEGNEEVIREHCSPEMIERLTGIIKAQKAQVGTVAYTGGGGG